MEKREAKFQIHNLQDGSMKECDLLNLSRTISENCEIFFKNKSFGIINKEKNIFFAVKYWQRCNKQVSHNYNLINEFFEWFGYFLFFSVFVYYCIELHIAMFLYGFGFVIAATLNGFSTIVGGLVSAYYEGKYGKYCTNHLWAERHARWGDLPYTILCCIETKITNKAKEKEYIWQGEVILKNCGILYDNSYQEIIHSDPFTL